MVKGRRGVVTVWRNCRRRKRKSNGERLGRSRNGGKIMTEGMRRVFFIAAEWQALRRNSICALRNYRMRAIIMRFAST